MQKNLLAKQICATILLFVAYITFLYFSLCMLLFVFLYPSSQPSTFDSSTFYTVSEKTKKNNEETITLCREIAKFSRNTLLNRYHGKPIEDTIEDVVKTNFYIKKNQDYIIRVAFDAYMLSLDKNNMEGNIEQFTNKSYRECYYNKKPSILFINEVAKDVMWFK